MQDPLYEQMSYASDPDVLLMLEFQKGHRASFENLMRKYYKRVFNFIYRFTGNRESSEDLTQEVFLKVYKSGEGYHPRAKFQTWLYTIAKNTALNELRRLKRPMVSRDAGVALRDGDDAPRQMADTGAEDPAQALLQKERAQAVQEAVGSLPENQRIAVILFRYERMRYEEIARAMGVSVSAVKSLLSRAREGLRQRLGRFIRL